MEVYGEKPGMCVWITSIHAKGNLSDWLPLAESTKGCTLVRLFLCFILSGDGEKHSIRSKEGECESGFVSVSQRWWLILCLDVVTGALTTLWHVTNICTTSQWTCFTSLQAECDPLQREGSRVHCAALRSQTIPLFGTISWTWVDFLRMWIMDYYYAESDVQEHPGLQLVRQMQTFYVLSTHSQRNIDCDYATLHSIISVLHPSFFWWEGLMDQLIKKLFFFKCILHHMEWLLQLSCIKCAMTIQASIQFFCFLQLTMSCSFIPVTIRSRTSLYLRYLCVPIHTASAMMRVLFDFNWSRVGSTW